MSNCVPLSWNQRGGWWWWGGGVRGCMGVSEGAALLLVFCLREVKRNVFGALRVRTHEPGRLFARAPYATLNTSPVLGSDGTLSLATHPPTKSASRHPCKRTHMRPHVSQGLGLIAWVGGGGEGGWGGEEEAVWCYCGDLSRLMTPGTRSLTDG